MRSLVFGAATVIAMAASVVVKAADLAFLPRWPDRLSTARLRSRWLCLRK